MCLRGPGYSWGREYPHLLSRHFALSRELFTATVRRCVRTQDHAHPRHPVVCSPARCPLGLLHAPCDR